MTWDTCDRRPRHPIRSGDGFASGHLKAETLDGRLVTIHHGQYSPLGHHGDSIAEGQNLVEVLGDDQYRHTPNRDYVNSC